MAEYLVVQPANLGEFGARVFQALGAPEEVAGEVAAHLVRANLAGHDSHGAIRIPQYALQISQGLIDPAAEPVIVHRRGATLLIDGQGGFGHYTTAFALDRAIEVAQEL